MEERKLRFAPLFKLMRHRRTWRYLSGEFIYPINIEFSPSGVCNTNCKKCFYRQENFALKGWEKVYFDFERFELLVRELREFKVKSISWTGGGEPTMHPQFKEMTKLANTYGIEQGLFTNALKPIDYDPSVFTWIRVTKTDEPLNIENLKVLRSCRTLGIVVNYTDENIGEMVKVVEELDSLKKHSSFSTYLQVRAALEIKGKVTLKVPPVVINHPLVEITEYKFRNEGRGYDKCRAFHITPFIWQNGDVDVCAYHKGEKDYHLGSLYKTTFSEIMRNAPDFVNVVPDCQDSCKLHEMNCFLEDMTRVTDTNFI
jgi:MoaA/NifB/PqqE/SkfB family radical SAM enzyme